MGKQLFLVIVLFYLIALTLSSEIIEKTKDPREINVGLGEVLEEGEAGATFGAEVIHHQKSFEGKNSDWEGKGSLDPVWNQKIIKERNSKMAKLKKERLEKEIKIQKEIIQAQEMIAAQKINETEMYFQKIGERPAEKTAKEFPIDDGYINDKLNNQNASADCTDISYTNSDDMQASIVPPSPPQLNLKYPPSQKAPKSKKILSPAVFTLATGDGELDAKIGVSYTGDSTDRDTDMRELQNWSLIPRSVVTPFYPETFDLVLSKSAGGSTHKNKKDNINNVQANQVLSDAVTESTTILSQKFNTEEVENEEGGLDSMTAWGVMNIQPERDMGSEGLQPINWSEFSSSPSPSPPPLPLEIYAEDDGRAASEIMDHSFHSFVKVPASQVMRNTKTRVEDPILPTNQISASRQQISYLGKYFHPKTIDPSTIQSTGLTGMGRQKQS